MNNNEHLLNEKEWQDYCAFKHIEPQIRGCLDREREYIKQIAEKDEEIERYKDYLSCSGFFPVVEKAKREKFDFAIEWLEKIKDFATYHYGEYSAVVITHYIDNQIKQLKEKQNG